jgi:hypothetical protein
MNRHNLSDDFHERTIQVWQPHVDRKLAYDDAREIVENLTGFFHALMEWDAKERAASNSAPDRAGAERDDGAT